MSKNAAVHIYVPTDGSLANAWFARDFNDSKWRVGVNGVGYEAVPGAYDAVVLADSVGDWSRRGQQAENNWFYGYYDLTLDADAHYDATDFVPFPRANGPWSPANFWDGGSWNWNPGVPWDTIGETAVHPNSFANGAEHWVIRRWRSTYTGPVTLVLSFRKQSIACGSGSTAKIFHNGAELFSRAITGNDSWGYVAYVTATVNAGDYFDFAQTPVGADGDPDDRCDGSRLTVRVLEGTVANPKLADSAADWGGGKQGEGDWYKGFYDKSADGDGVYEPNTDFTYVDPNWTFNGCWTLGPADPPWDMICQLDIHPNGINNAAEHWVIRDYKKKSGYIGPVRTISHVRKVNLNGSGVTHHTIINGKIVRSDAIDGGDSEGIYGIAEGYLGEGRSVDFALSPIGLGGATGDGADGSWTAGRVEKGPSIAKDIQTDVRTEMFGVSPTMYLRYPFSVSDPASYQSLELRIKYNDGFIAYLNGKPVAQRNQPMVTPLTVADSVDDWVPAKQGANGWFYGYYDKSLDADATYQGEDFTLFPHDGGGWSPTDFWSGSQWAWFQGNPPWDEITQGTGHPNHPNGGSVDPDRTRTHEHWVIRRWVSNRIGDLRLRVRFYKTIPDCGDGVVVRAFRNGFEIYAQGIAYNDGSGRDDIVELLGMEENEVIDVALTPGAGNDFCDGTFFRASIVDQAPEVPWDAPASAPRYLSGATEVAECIDLTDQLGLLIGSPGVQGVGGVVARQNVLAIRGLNTWASDPTFLIRAELIANRRPVAAADVTGVAINGVLVCPASALSDNDSDPDGDPVTVTGVAAATPQGGTARFIGDTLYYHPPVDFTGKDTVTYNLNDPSGGGATGTLTVVVGTVKCVTIVKTPTECQLGFRGVPGAGYEVRRATQLNPSNWAAISPSLSAATDGTFGFTDTAPPDRHAYYQARLVSTK
ncbi:MAG TPA: Ig-like domain-containing protein [Verrucomicrobiota bacterium]|nr:Ig-like domain-containing protein [Verrucomicrobiota bacterium]